MRILTDPAHNRKTKNLFLKSLLLGTGILLGVHKEVQAVADIVSPLAEEELSLTEEIFPTPTDLRSDTAQESVEPAEDEQPNYSPFRELIKDILKIPEAIISSQLTVQGKAHFLDHTVMNDVTVTGDFSQGGTLFIRDGERIDNLAGDLRLQKDSLVISREGTVSAKHKIELADDNLTEEDLETLEASESAITRILENVRNLFEVKVANTLVAYLDNTGRFFARVLAGRKVETDMISPLSGGDLAIRLGEGAEGKELSSKEFSELSSGEFGAGESASETSKTLPTRLKILNSENTEVASIDSEGTGTFTKLNISENPPIPQPVGLEEKPDGFSSAGSIGSATIPAGRLQILIRTTAITANSKIFVTPTSSTGGQIPYVLTKTAGSYFIVKIDRTLNHDLGFDWWVVN